MCGSASLLGKNGDGITRQFLFCLPAVITHSETVSSCTASINQYTATLIVKLLCVLRHRDRGSHACLEDENAPNTSSQLQLKEHRQHVFTSQATMLTAASPENILCFFF